METIYDFKTGKVNKQNRQRKTFINTMAFCMQQFSSSSVEVNELINWLFCMSDDQNYYPIDEVTLLGRRMFRKDNSDYVSYHTYPYIIDKSAGAYQGTPTKSFNWEDFDLEQEIDIPIIIVDLLLLSLKMLSLL